MEASHVCRTTPVADRSRTGLFIATRLFFALVVLTPLLPKQLRCQPRGTPVRVLTGTALRTTPSGPVIGTLNRNLDAEVESEQGTSVRVQMVGFVNTDELAVEPSGTRATLKLADGAALRTAAAQGEPILAQLRHGTVLFPQQKVGGFLSVVRSVWVDKTRLAKLSTPANSAAPITPAARAASFQQTPPAANGVTPAVVAGAPDSRLVQTKTAVPLVTVPNGNEVANIKAGAAVTELSQENGWTRVRVEGWVPSNNLVATKSLASAEPSAADLRAAADGMKGRIVHWEVEALSYQIADGLRRELDGTPYILALGPGKERAILYLAVPDSLVATARGLPPMTVISVAAKVRTGRSQPGGVPILDLLELSRH